MPESESAPSVELVDVAADELSDWLTRMEAAFIAGIRDAGLQPGEEPIPTAAETRDDLAKPGTDALQILRDGVVVGGVSVSSMEGGRRSLDLLFIDDGHQGTGIGFAAWNAVEVRYPDTTVWETYTPYFDQRNIHFYINRCGFSATEFLHPGYRGELGDEDSHEGPSRMFRFEKRTNVER